MQIELKAQRDNKAAGEYRHGANAENRQNGVAHAFSLHRLAGNEARKLQHNANKHDRTGLRRLAGQRHDAGKNAFTTLAGDHLINVGDVGVDIPRHVVDAAATKSGQRRDHHQQRHIVIHSGKPQARIRDGAQSE